MLIVGYFVNPVKYNIIVTGHEVKVKMLVAQSCLTLCNPWIVACQAPLSMEFSRQEYGSELLFPLSGDLPNPGIEPMSHYVQIF